MLQLDKTNLIFDVVRCKIYHDILVTKGIDKESQGLGQG